MKTAREARGMPTFEAVSRRIDTSGVCWAWRGSRVGGGYGKAWDRDRKRGIVAHRLVYELLVGAIPAGLQLDHLCRNRGCVRPDHLEPVTGRENIMRGDTPAARNAAKTRCINGHEYTPENTKLNRATGQRKCRICSRVSENGRYRKLNPVVAANSQKTHCLRGHEFAGDNLMVFGGHRKCRACQNEGQRRRWVPKAVRALIPKEDSRG